MLLSLLLAMAAPLRADPPANLVVLDANGSVGGADAVRVIVSDKKTKDEYQELLDAVAPGRVVETVDEYAAHADANAVMSVRAKLYGRKAVVYRYAKNMKSPTPQSLKTAPPAQRAAPQPAVQRDPQMSQQLYLEGVIFYQKGDSAKTRERWEQALALDPKNDDARAGLEKLTSSGR